jgi:hypothetical protein
MVLSRQCSKWTSGCRSRTNRHQLQVFTENADHLGKKILCEFSQSVDHP